MFTKQQKPATNYTNILTLFLLAAFALFGGAGAITPTAAQIARDDQSVRVKNVRPATDFSVLPLLTGEEPVGDKLLGGLFDARNGGGGKSESPVTETGVFKKPVAFKSFRDWLTAFLAREKVGKSEDAVAGGFPAIVFDAEIGGELRRGIAVDYGDYLMFHLTTDKAATSDDLMKASFDRMEMVARAGTDLDPNNPDRCNCVLYVRNNFVSSLPNPLTYASQKRNVINHYFPRVPSAAIHPINSGRYAENWHVSAVRNIVIDNTNGSLKLTIREANYPSCGIYERTGTPEQLGIMGYYDPTYPATSGSRSDMTAPKLNTITNSSVPRGREHEIVANGANFEASNSQIVIFGGWCDAWGKCVIPNSHLRQPTSTKLRIPLIMNNPGDYHVYVFNPTTGKTSDGKKINVY